MPRIDPQQLLTCLQVLLSPTGGILSTNEVQRLANLMTKFSKKLVSKCIYVLILKNTEKQLLGAFMAEGGWNLIHLWLQDAHVNKNWALVAEVLELLLVTPVDVERLKMNNLPKLVKGLSKRDDLQGIQQLASALVEQWLTLVKDVTKQEQQLQQQAQPITELAVGDQSAPMESAVTMLLESETTDDPDAMDIDETISNDAHTIVSENGVDTSLRIKFVRDGKKVISRVVAVRTENSTDDANMASSVVDATSSSTTTTSTNKNEDSEETGTDKENSDKQKSVPKKCSSSSKSSSSNSIKDKDRSSRDRSKSSSSRSGSSSKSSSSSSKDRDRRDRDKDRDRHKNGSSSSSSSSKHRSSSSKSSSSSSSKDSSKKDSSSSSSNTKESKEKQAEKDKDTLAKIQPQTLQKIGRIPKKSEDSKKEPKKSSFSVEVRKNAEEKPKTVKVYNSKMRSTGLMEEAKPPPPRSATKKTAAPAALPASIPVKRSSPVRDTIPPPEKKSRLMESSEKGGIKLIPPKPKPAVLQESDIFMDALTASASTKKEPKKRKRRTSTSKDSSPPTSPSSKSTPTSPTVLKNITPANFYQDTLVTENDEAGGDVDNQDVDNKSDKDNENKGSDTPAEPDDESMEETTKTDANGLKGVLSYGKRKGPKRSIRWRPDADLVEVQYFELDETERVNVMKNFMDMQRMEMSNEREAMRQRKLPNEDIMDTQTQWRALIEIECPAPPAEIGSKSLEKNIQFAREKTVLQAIYFNNRLPDTPAEPDHEVHPMVTAIVIPLHDPDQPDQEQPIHPWAEPKGSPPQIAPTNTPPSLFSNVPPPFMQGAFAPNGFVPGFAPPPSLVNGAHGANPDWNGMNMLPNGIPAKFPPPDLMQQVPPIAPIAPMFDNFNGPRPMGGPDGFPPFPNPMPQMFPPNNFNNNMRGRGAPGGAGGGFRRGGNNGGPWLRMGAPNQGGGVGNPNWNNQNNRGRGFCNSFKQKGYCRNRDNCPYIH